jgi:hypothetical protein
VFRSVPWLRPRCDLGDQQRFEQAAHDHDPSPEGISATSIAWPIRARLRLVDAGGHRPVTAGDVGHKEELVVSRFGRPLTGATVQWATRRWGAGWWCNC